MYGICQRFYPPKREKKSVSSMRSLQIVLAYNKTDWTYGWNYMMDGFSIFYTPEGELVLDPMTSVTVNSRIVPVLLLQQHRNIKLGSPYTICHNISDEHLKYFKSYTKKNCHLECLIDAIFDECKCGPPYFPIKEGIPMCTFSQHVNCVSKQLKDFDYANCVCQTQCSELYYQKTVYYTEIHQNFRNKTAKMLKRFPDIELASARISLPDPYEYQHQETADYDIYKYLSDVGGAMSLVLGVSFVSFLEMCECLLAGTRSGWKNRRRIAKATRRSLTTIGLIKPALTTFLKTTAILGSTDGLNDEEIEKIKNENKNKNKEPSKSPVTVVRKEPKSFEKLESAPPSPSYQSQDFDQPEPLRTERLSLNLNDVSIDEANSSRPPSPYIRYYRNVYPEAHSGGMIISNNSSITININENRNHRPTLRNIGRNGAVDIRGDSNETRDSFSYLEVLSNQRS